MLRANGSVLADNRKAYFNYEIIETLEVGLVLTGSEVKSLRLGKVSLVEAHASAKGDDLLLFNCTIVEYVGSNRFNHEPKRPRKLLLKKREQGRLISSVQKKGLTLIPLVLYFNDKGKVKLKLALAKGKSLVDKRNTIKERDWSREKQRLLKTKDHD
jgi:SsrA-binding protein